MSIETSGTIVPHLEQGMFGPPDVEVNGGIQIQGLDNSDASLH